MRERVDSNFTLTARSFEQLNTNSDTTSNPFAMSDVEFISNYTSTVNQTTVLAQNENKAIRSNAMATFVLGKSSAVKNYNLMMKRAQISYGLK